MSSVTYPVWVPTNKGCAAPRCERYARKACNTCERALRLSSFEPGFDKCKACREVDDLRLQVEREYFFQGAHQFDGLEKDCPIDLTGPSWIDLTQ